MSRGFTLIELVVVIVVLGVLAATATPKFVSLRSEAKIAKMQAYAGALHSGITLAVAKWQASGSPAAGLTMNDGSTVSFSNGYPTAATVKNVIQIDSSNPDIYVMTSSSGASFCYVDSGSVNCGTPPPLTGPAWLIAQSKAGYTYCAFAYYAATSSSGSYTLDSSYLTSTSCQ